MKIAKKIIAFTLLQLVFLTHCGYAYILNNKASSMLSPQLNIHRTLIGSAYWFLNKKYPQIDGIDNALRNGLENELSHLLESVFAKFERDVDVVGLDIDTILEDFMQASIQATKASYGSILIKDKEKPYLHFAYFTGPVSKKLRYLSMPDNVGISGQVMKSKVPAFVNEKDIKKISPLVDKHTDFNTRNILCFPIIVDGEVIALLELINKQDDFNQGDVNIISKLIDQQRQSIEEAFKLKEQRAAFLAACIKLADEIESKNAYTGGHVLRVKRYALMIAEELGLSDREKYEYQIAAILHDVGKISIPNEILDKEENLTPDEYDTMRMHAPLGIDYINTLKIKNVRFRDILNRFVDFDNIEKGIVFHHERLDGNGYFNLIGDEIPNIAKVIAVADIFDALTSDRPYHKGISFEEAINELKANEELQVCPDVVNAFIKSLENKKDLNGILAQENLIDRALSDNIEIANRALAEFKKLKGIKARRFERDYLLSHKESSVEGFWELRYLLGEETTDFIIDSIVKNALKFGKGRSVVVVRILDGQRVKLIIQDDGYGLDLSDIEPRLGISADQNGDLKSGKSNLWRLLERVVMDCKGNMALKSHDKYKVFFPSNDVQGWGSRLEINTEVNKGLRIEIGIPISNKNNKPINKIKDKTNKENINFVGQAI